MKRRSSLFSVSSLRRGLALLEWKQLQGQFRASHFLNSHRLTVKSSSQTPTSWLLNKKQQIAHFSRFSGSSVPASSLSASNIKFANDGNGKRLQIEINSENNIKPAVPTPDHLRTYEVSIFDIMSPHMYVPFVYFYQNNDSKYDLNQISERRQLLRQSLSETLTRFYPFAGKVQGERYIDCNDDGVYYADAKVKDQRSLSEFLKEPDNRSIHQLVPFHSRSNELSSQTYVAMIQVTSFGCGGIAIGLTTSHRIVDGYSHMFFLKAWASTARGGSPPEIINPDFTSPSIFFPNLPQPPDAGLALMPFFSNQNKSVMKRFLFPKSSITHLKKKAGGSSRVMAVTGFIWKCAITASKSREDGILRRTFNLMLPLNMRGRSTLPPLPPYSVGNLHWIAIAQCCPSDEQDIGLSTIVDLLKNATNKIDGDFIAKMAGEEGNVKVGENFIEMNKFHSDKNAEYMVVSSLCNGGIFEADFGWGKPVWACLGNGNLDIPHLRNFVYLMDTRSGDGIEAWVSLSERDMALFEKNPEVVEFAYVDASPIDQSVS